MRIQSLGLEDPLEKEMATRSSILAWEIPWTEKPGRLQSMGLQKSRTQQLNNNLAFQPHHLLFPPGYPADKHQSPQGDSFKICKTSQGPSQHYMDF